MAATYTLSSLAYLKIVLHAAKYPDSAVTGILLGTSSGSGAVSVKDAVPCLHHWTGLSPMMELALELADTHAKGKGLEIVGLYSANERLEDKSVSFAASKVSTAIRSQFGNALLLVVDNEQLASPSPALIPHTFSAQKWVPASFSLPTYTLQDSSIPGAALLQARNGKYADLGDFDEHLEDARVDWLVNAKVAVA